MNVAVLIKLARAVPRYGRLVYCLYRDPRTPFLWKACLTLAVALIVTPFVNIPEVVPVLGEMETVGLILLAVRIAVARAPRDLVEEHEAAIRAGTSFFHRDVDRAMDGVDELRGRVAG